MLNQLHLSLKFCFLLNKANKVKKCRKNILQLTCYRQSFHEPDIFNLSDFERPIPVFPFPDFSWFP